MHRRRGARRRRHGGLEVSSEGLADHPRHAWLGWGKIEKKEREEEEEDRKLTRGPYSLLHFFLCHLHMTPCLHVSESDHGQPATSVGTTFQTIK